jgi:hypothetical protein
VVRIARQRKDAKVGLCICRHNEKKEEEEEVMIKPVNARKNVIADPTTKLLAQTEAHLVPPKMKNIERKLQIGNHEMYIESSFANYDLAALYFHFLPIEGPLVIIPCLSEKNKYCGYRMTICADKPIEIERLKEDRNVALIGAWLQYQAGGCELYDKKYYKSKNMQTWAFNPQYTLTFATTEPAWIKVTLVIADKNWKGNLAKKEKEKKKKEREEREKRKESMIPSKKNTEEQESFNLSVGTMISIYLLRKSEQLSPEDIITKAPFVPMLKTEIVNLR